MTMRNGYNLIIGLSAQQVKKEEHREEENHGNHKRICQTLSLAARLAVARRPRDAERIHPSAAEREFHSGAMARRNGAPGAADHQHRRHLPHDGPDEQTRAHGVGSPQKGGHRDHPNDKQIQRDFPDRLGKNAEQRRAADRQSDRLRARRGTGSRQDGGREGAFRRQQYKKGKNGRRKEGEEGKGGRVWKDG